MQHLQIQNAYKIHKIDNKHSTFAHNIKINIQIQICKNERYR